MASPSESFKNPAQADKWKQKQNLERSLISKCLGSPGRGCGAGLWELPRTARYTDSVQGQAGGPSLGGSARVSVVKEKKRSIPEQ